MIDRARRQLLAPELTRRRVLLAAGAVALVGSGARAQESELVAPLDLESHEAELAANRVKAESILAGIIAARPLRQGLISGTVPDIAEDGNAVPVSFKVACSMTGDDYPASVHIIAMVNPFPEIARFHFTPACGEAEVSFRCRMRATSNLVLVADMADGTVGLSRHFVDVAMGACS
jgi:sulfur-oxidizing protein SoxY